MTPRLKPIRSNTATPDTGPYYSVIYDRGDPMPRSQHIANQPFSGVEEFEISYHGG